MLDQRLVGVGVGPRVDSLVADRVALGVGRIVHRAAVPHASMLRRCADLAGRAPCDTSAITWWRGTSSWSRSRFLGRRLATCAALPASWARYAPSGPRWRAISRHTAEGLRPIKRAIHTWDKPASNPTIIATRSSTLSIRRQLTISPSSSTATTQIADTL